jgi:dTDP-4-dehydrorhamnose reductase
VAESGARYLILRTSWVYSPFGNNFVKTMLRLAAGRDAIAVVDDQRGCPTSAFDIAAGIAAVVRRWAVDPSAGLDSILHLAGSGETDWAGFARAVFEESASRGGPSATVIGIPSTDFPTRAARPSDSRLNSTRFAQIFGYGAPPWRKSLRAVVGELIDR